MKFSSALLIIILLLFVFADCRNGLEERQSLYENGQLHEQWTVKLDKESNYIGHGEYVAWHENGQKKQEEYWKDGKLHGYFITWHESGMKKQEGNYVEGKLDCLYREWDFDGHKIIEGKVVNGKQEGKWTFWDEKGNIFKQEDYKNGELINGGEEESR